MKRGLVLAIISAFALTIWAQNPGNDTPDPNFEQLKKQIQEQVMTQLNQLPQEIQKQLQEAKKAAEQAQLTIKNMVKQGNTPEEIQAHMEQTRIQAMNQLEIAIKKMDQVTERVRAQIMQAKDDVQKKLQQKEGEIKKIQNGPGPDGDK